MRKHFSGGNGLKGLLCALAGALCVLLIIIIGFGGLKGFASAAKFAAVTRIIHSHFVGESDLDDVTDAALNAAILSLDDRWSYYMDATGYDDYQDYSANRYQGIGVTIRQEDTTGGFEILTLNKGDPAQLAGLQVGEIILAVDGVSVTGGTSEDVKALIQADYGKDAIITVRGLDGTERDVAVTCVEIYTDPVSYEMLQGHIGYVAIDNFRQGSGSGAVEAVRTLTEQGADSFVFDVRGNPGGQVSEMMTILDYLLPEGDVFIRQDKQGHEQIERSDASCVELPMAVVVNADSYSAAEFFAAALRDYDWAKIAGEHTTGKSRSQVTFSLWDGSAVHISKYSYLTPSRTDLYLAGGLEPDAEATLNEEELTQYQTGWLEPEDDPQVQAAVGLLTAIP